MRDHTSVTMDSQQPKPLAAPSSYTSGMDDSEELLAEVDEPPEHPVDTVPFGKAVLLQANQIFGKGQPRPFERRESLLTRQLHSEAEQTDEDDDIASPNFNPPRALSTQSTYSMASTAELTSDDGHSVPSPTVSPPFPPTVIPAAFPAITKLAETSDPQIAGHMDDRAPKDKVSSDPLPTEKTIEANLGRKRCISFACGGAKDVRTAPAQPVGPEPAIISKAVLPVVAVTQSTTSASPPKRKCALKFVCPPTTRSVSASKTPVIPRPTTPIRHVSTPAPASARRSPSPKSVTLRPAKQHRDSDSTIRHASPTALRKSPSIVTTAATPPPAAKTASRRYSSDSLSDSGAATRFHEFASSDGESEEWCQESTAYRSRLTISDVLKKENILRRACEEAEEEAVEDDEEAEAELDGDDGEGDDENLEDEDVNEDDAVEEEEDLSDDGFRSDDEGGFAASDGDDDGEDSDADWWTPGGLSTAATSVEHMHTLLSNLPADDDLHAEASSLSSGGSIAPHIVPVKGRQHPPRRTRHSRPIVGPREPDVSDLPDSTDFVCGTLDEDRPVEQAFRDHILHRAAARQGPLRPQDIDPTFPTSDPEMDEEDDDEEDATGNDKDEDEVEDEDEMMMHGEMDPIESDEERSTARPLHRTVSISSNSTKSTRTHGPSNGRLSKSPAPQKTKFAARSPAPPSRRSTRSPSAFSTVLTRARSPAPGRAKSITSINNTSRSPPPHVKIRSTARSPPPAKMRINTRSPPPNRAKASARSSPTAAAPRAKSPAPRKLFGDHSPRRARSPAPRAMLTSPQQASPTSGTSSVLIAATATRYPAGLAVRPPRGNQAASLPRGGEFVLSRLASYRLEEADEEDEDAANVNESEDWDPTPSVHARGVKKGKNTPIRIRGAIDIVKGLEKKRQRRKEKLLQKAAAKAAAGGKEKSHKVKPGKGAERMKEIGLELQRYRGGGEHIISM